MEIDRFTADFETHVLLQFLGIWNDSVANTCSPPSVYYDTNTDPWANTFNDLQWTILFELFQRSLENAKSPEYFG